jgi:His/Glu/Gln/Arg/opine family amino acid ABC transporter permease subunit
MIDRIIAAISANVVWEWLPQLLDGAWDTVRMALISFFLSLLLGLGLALARESRLKLLRGAAISFIELFRGTPLLTQLFIIYFSLSSIGISFSPFSAAIIGLTLNSGAYIAEIYRAGILAVDIGQREAAQAIGMTSLQAMIVVVLPQALRACVPNLANYGVIILKSTSIASIVSAPDLMMQAHDLSSEYFMPMEVYLLTAAIYIVMAFPLSRAAGRLEARLNRGRL